MYFSHYPSPRGYPDKPLALLYIIFIKLLIVYRNRCINQLNTTTNEKKKKKQSLCAETQLAELNVNKVTPDLASHAGICFILASC